MERFRMKSTISLFFNPELVSMRKMDKQNIKNQNEIMKKKIINLYYDLFERGHLTFAIKHNNKLWMENICKLLCPLGAVLILSLMEL